jgi:hypothetical protein
MGGKMGHFCSNEFEKGQSKRAQFQLRSGAYKLEEARGGLLDSLHLLDSVREFTSVPQGARGALKRLPRHLACELGWSIIPAVEALAGDNLPPSIVIPLARRARAEAQDLVRRCDELHDSFLRGGIAAECVYIKHDRSELERLLRDAVSLIDVALHAHAASLTMSAANL